MSIRQGLAGPIHQLEAVPRHLQRLGSRRMSNKGNFSVSGGQWRGFEAAPSFPLSLPASQAVSLLHLCSSRIVHFLIHSILSNS
jgi:hypothetical protein